MTRLHSTSRVRTRILKSDGTGGANHESSGTTRRAREEVLGHKEEELRKLASEGKRDEFFREIIPLLKPLRSYIKRRLRGARLTQRADIPVLSSVDMLDDVMLEAYEKFNRKPKRLTLEQWLYRLANEELDRYVSKRRPTEKRRKSLETLTQTELRTLEEMPITADADGEVWFPRNWRIANIRRSNFCRRPLTILLSNSSRGENRSSRSLGLSPNFPSASERCSNSTLSKVSQKELWPESLACQWTRFRASRKRSKSIFDKRSRRIRNRRKEAKRPLDQERLSSYPFIT
jgi:DNA-directed RNA polymerase specialized sigma24 family protein